MLVRGHSTNPTIDRFVSLSLSLSLIIKQMSIRKSMTRCEWSRTAILQETRERFLFLHSRVNLNRDKCFYGLFGTKRQTRWMVRKSDGWSETTDRQMVRQEDR